MKAVMPSNWIRFAYVAAVLSLPLRLSAADGDDGGMARWLGPQTWERDVDGPVVSLGESGAFDDTHLFAPCVMCERDRYWLWYCGSRGTVAERVMRMGLATGDDGRAFAKHADSPVFEFGDGRRSVLTPTILKDTSGLPLREQGRLRMWFSATDFTDPTGRHTLHETTSEDGLRWSPPSAAQLEHVYAPTVVRDENGYQLWYSDVSREPWIIRHAASPDGKSWRVTEKPVVVSSQPWEKGRLFYPAVIRVDGLFLMWYGSYWRDQPNKTAIGFAVSADGLEWHKSSHNPVLRPDPERAWESHYTTSQSVIRLPDGSFRIWYASRKAPPFRNKYFAIGTARWPGPTPPDAGKPE